MGIQLPPELAAVAERAGVAWPQADEDKLREQAAAWRDAGTKLTTLTRDADQTASTTLTAVSGATGDAARRHWSTFVAPDTGHLTATARGCTAAADRLDHAAHQVGAAKVEIVRNLVSLAKNSDAAHQAAGAGHPNALLGLDTAVRATNANVTHITNTLATAVVPSAGVDVSLAQPVANANPGAAITDPVLSTVDRTVGDVVPGSGAPGLQDLAHPRHPDTTGPVRIPPVDVGPVRVDPGGLPLDPGHGRVPVDPGSAHGVLPGNPGAAPGLLPIDAPTPPTGIPAGPGQTFQAGLVPGGILDPGAPAQVSPGAATGFGGASPGGAPGQPIPPQPAGGPLGGAAPAVPAPGGPAVPAPGGGAGMAPAPGAPARPAPGPIAGIPAPAAGAPAPSAGAPAPAGPPAALPGDGPRGRGPMTTAVPPGPPAPPQPQVPAPPVPRERREDGPLLFWMHMFPIGHMPVVSDRPARQLPTPPPEVDFAPGLRFAPGDHPRHDEIAATPAARVPVGQHDGLPVGHPTVAALAMGHDPLGGQHEREWDRRYLVRLGSVTPQGISSAGKEYAWPPGESYPEGGSADGDAEILNEGMVIDRFGSPRGRVFSADGTSFAARSLPPDHLAVGYRRYRVCKPLPVWRTISAPWFGQPGGGERYRATYSATELVALGYLEDIT